MTKFQNGENLTEEEIHGMLKEADLNGDGQIDYNGKVQGMLEGANLLNIRAQLFKAL